MQLFHERFPPGAVVASDDDVVVSSPALRTKPLDSRTTADSELFHARKQRAAQAWGGTLVHTPLSGKVAGLTSWYVGVDINNGLGSKSGVCGFAAGDRLQRGNQGNQSLKLTTMIG